MSRPRPPALRKRDIHAVCIVASIAACNVVATCCWIFFIRPEVKRAYITASVARDFCADASGALSRSVAVMSNLAVRLSVGSGGSSFSQASATASPQILGYGTTKSAAALYRYRDVRGVDGTVHREYLSREPLLDEKSNTAYLDLLRFLQARRIQGATNNVSNAQQSSSHETMLEQANTDSGNAAESLPRETMLAPTNNVCDGDKNLTRQILLAPPNVPRGTRVATDYRL